jgi:hypothetical protein
LSYPLTANGSAAIIGGLLATVANANYVNTAGGLDGNGVNLSGAFVRPVKNTTTFAVVGSAGPAATNANLSNVTISSCLIYPAS